MRKGLVLGGMVLGVVGLLALGTSPAMAAPGNNGDIHVVTTTNPDGTPGCAFDLQFSDFDPGALTSTVTFSLQAPTQGTVADPFATRSVSFTGGPGLDATATLDLSTELLASGAQPEDGAYHVKVDTATPFSNGSDGKSKVFWVGACVIIPS